MRLVCPECGTEYEVSETVVSPGKTVECFRCLHRWKAVPKLSVSPKKVRPEQNVIEETKKAAEKEVPGQSSDPVAASPAAPSAPQASEEAVPAVSADIPPSSSQPPAETPPAEPVPSDKAVPENTSSDATEIKPETPSPAAEPSAAPAPVPLGENSVARQIAGEELKEASSLLIDEETEEAPKNEEEDYFAARKAKREAAQKSTGLSPSPAPAGKALKKPQETASVSLSLVIFLWGLSGAAFIVIAIAFLYVWPVGALHPLYAALHKIGLPLV